MQDHAGSKSPPDGASSGADPTLPRNVRLLGLASLLNDIAGEMIFPLVPTFLLTVLGGGKEALGLVEGIADTTASVVKLWSGTLSDRVGKRKAFVVAGYAIAAVARPLVGLATAPWHVLVVRSADRFGKGIRAAPRDALIADSAPPELLGRAFGFTRSMDHLGAAIGPLVAFAFLWMWPGQLRTLFLLAAIPGAIVVACIVWGLRERPPAAGRERKPSLRSVPLDRRFRTYLIAVAVFALANSSDSFLLVRVRELGVSTVMLPLIWGAFSITKSAVSLLAGRAVDRFSARPVIATGWLVFAAIYLAFGLATGAVQAWTIFLGYAFFDALAEPAERAFVATLVGQEHKGLGYGWFNLTFGLASLPANLVFGALYEEYGAQAAFAWSAALAVIAVVILACVGRARPPD